jgi:NAD(P)H-dependent flavin oxidoreductase YrpB (nitropropane dioxygenase family)
MKTRVAGMLGIEFPIFAFSHCRDVVAAVTNAGGFGVLGAVALSPEQLEIELTWIDDQVKGKPYGLDLLFPTVSGGLSEVTREGIGELLPEAHRQFVDGILRRYDVPELPDDIREQIATASGSLALARGLYERMFEVSYAHGIKLIASGLGSPPADVVEEAHRNGALVLALAGAKVHAERHANAGVDLIVAQGTEAGGHTGEVATMVLVPEVVDAVAPIPVIAAGGIANGRQIAAAMALGAEGVWCGSVWLTTEEAETDPVVKAKFLAATSRDTVRSKSLTGKPARMLRSAWTDEWESPESPGTLPLPLQSALIARARNRIARSAHVKGSGAEQLHNYFVGQVVGQLNTVKPVRQVVHEMVSEYVDASQRIADQLHAMDD